MGEFLCRHETGLTLLQQRLCQLAPGDVAHERTVVFLSFVEQIIDTHLDGNQSTILGSMDSFDHHGLAPPGLCPKAWPPVHLKFWVQIVDGHGA